MTIHILTFDIGQEDAGAVESLHTFREWVSNQNSDPCKVVEEKMDNPNWEIEGFEISDALLDQNGNLILHLSVTVEDNPIEEHRIAVEFCVEDENNNVEDWFKDWFTISGADAYAHYVSSQSKNQDPHDCSYMSHLWLEEKFDFHEAENAQIWKNVRQWLHSDEMEYSISSKHSFDTSGKDTYCVLVITWNQSPEE